MIDASPASQRTAPRLRGLSVALILAAFGWVGCSKQLTTVDSNYAPPEGHFSSMSRMVVWYDASTTVEYYKDASPPGGALDECGRPIPGLEDTLIRTEQVRRHGAGSINGVVFDGTAASDYQVLRRESGGGFRAFQDFTAAHTNQWLNSQWELFRFDDPAPSHFTPPTYVGRGVVLGAVTTESPLSNMAELGSTPIADLNYTGLCLPLDSLFTLQWDPVPGAVQYCMQVYRFRGDLRSIEERILSGVPSPVYDGQSTDLFVGLLQGSNTRYRLGDSTRTDVTILHQATTRFGTEYFVRVAAVNAEGQLIACTRGNYSNPIGISDAEYALYRLGAIRVIPTRPSRSLQDSRPASQRSQEPPASYPRLRRR